MNCCHYTGNPSLKEWSRWRFNRLWGLPDGYKKYGVYRMDTVKLTKLSRLGFQLVSWEETDDAFDEIMEDRSGLVIFLSKPHWIGEDRIIFEVSVMFARLGGDVRYILFKKEKDKYILEKEFRTKII
jgi:hypothetical protein